jgi:hypothetical protein
MTLLKAAKLRGAPAVAVGAAQAPGQASWTCDTAQWDDVDANFGMLEMLEMIEENIHDWMV